MTPTGHGTPYFHPEIVVRGLEEVNRPDSEVRVSPTGSETTPTPTDPVWDLLEPRVGHSCPCHTGGGENPTSYDPGRRDNWTRRTDKTRSVLTDPDVTSGFLSVGVFSVRVPVSDSTRTGTLTHRYRLLDDKSRVNLPSISLPKQQGQDKPSCLT